MAVSPQDRAGVAVLAKEYCKIPGGRYRPDGMARESCKPRPAFRSPDPPFFALPVRLHPLRSRPDAILSTFLCGSLRLCDLCVSPVLIAIERKDRREIASD
jgi:hypothetical protein